MNTRVLSAAAAEDSSSTTLSARRNRGMLALLSLALALFLVTLISLGYGPVSIPPQQVLTVLLQQIGITLPWEFEPQHQAVIMSIRLPRTMLGILVGAALAVSGAALQGLFRNPLADPALIGVSAGASLAAVSVIVLGTTGLAFFITWFGPFALPLAAFCGGFLATLLVYRLASSGGRTVVATMLLAGIAINAIAMAGVGLFIFVADDQQLRSLTFWNLGSLGRATWATLGGAIPLLLAPLFFIPRLARALNALLLGEAEAGHLGVDADRVKRWLVLWVALGVGAAVAVSGVIGFVGLVVPHLIRLALGPDHRYLLPGSMLLGATLLLGADLLARTVVAPAELPIGIVTSLLGGPFFLWLLLKQKQRSYF